MLISAGMVVARLLGFAFSLLLAGVFDPGDYGYVQYYIALSGMVAIVTQPFVQHTLARFIGKHYKDRNQLQLIITNSWVILAALIGLTLVVMVPALALLKKLNAGVIVIFLCSSLFYAYWGLSRGFQSPGKLIAAYLGSNLMQIILALLVIQVLQIHSTQLALLVYGLSYLVPLLVLQIWFPYPAFFDLKYLSRKAREELIRFSFPIWLSHGGYVIFSTLDMLMLEYFKGEEVLGVYSLARTLSLMFTFVPEGVATLLMPKVASLANDKYAKLLKNTLLVSLLVNFLIFLVYVVAIPWGVRIAYGEEYLSSMDVIVVLALGMITAGLHSVATAVLVGAGKAKYETISRFVSVLVMSTAGVLLIPRFAALGAALALWIGALGALGTYGVIALIHRSKEVQVAA